MKRKRFIKLLMEAGMSRNDAADCAALTQNAGRSYFKVLGELLNFHRHQFNHRALCISWLKIRHTVIHGHNSTVGRFFANIDEVHTWPAQGGYVAKVNIVDELPPLNPNVRMDGTTQRIILHPGQPAPGGGMPSDLVDALTDALAAGAAVLDPAIHKDKAGNMRITEVSIIPAGGGRP